MTLADAPDVLTLAQVCELLQISRRELYRLRQHGAFVDPLPHLRHRWSKTAVQRFIDGHAPRNLRRSA